MIICHPKLIVSSLGMGLLIMLSSCQAITKKNAAEFSDEAQFVSKLIDKMTIEEKIGQMNMYNGFFDVTGPAPKGGDAKMKYEQIKKGQVGAMLNVTGAEQVKKLQELAVENSRLGIPMLFGFDVIHGFKTTFPIPLAEAATWDMELIEKSARIAAIEASAVGINWTFAPMVDISRDARWGRVMEGAGEDPFLGCEIAKARVTGFQGSTKNLNQHNTIAACAKHFAGYGFAESGKDYNTAEVSSVTLHNVILPPFIAAKEAGAATFMNAFNELNGVPATADVYLQRELLKGKWGFDGLMVSDWGSIIEMIDHGHAENSEDATRLALEGGCDMDMESNCYINHLETLLSNEKIKIEDIDDAVKRILTLKYRLGLFEDPYRYCNTEREKTLLHHSTHHDLAREVAQNSIVLLKNDDLLPLKESGLKIGLIGDLADCKNSPLGNWRLGSDDHSAVSVKEGLEEYDHEVQSTDGVTLAMGQEHFVFELKINESDSSDFQAARNIAKESDVVIMVLGEHGYQSGEGRSRSNIGLPGLQQQLLETVYAQNKNIVLVLMSGRPMQFTWADDKIPSIVQAWQLGTQSGHAITDVLFGKHNPCGKLPMTIPRHSGQVPVYYNHKRTGRPGPKSEVFWSHYIDETNSPLRPFGFGLSYTTFEYSDLQVNYNATSTTVEATINLKNTGSVEGTEVVQLYIQDVASSTVRPIKELKGFQKIKMAAGESTSVTFNLDKNDLGYYNGKGEYSVENGKYIIMIGGNSSDLLIGEISI